MRTAPLRAEARSRKISAQTFYDWDAAGHIRTFMIGCRRHVDLDSLDAYLERLAAESRKQPHANLKRKGR